MKQRIAGVAGVVVTASAIRRRRDLARAAHKASARAGRWLRFQRGRLQGFLCRSLAVPDGDVDDAVLADRIRSSLGLLEHRLDVPRVHVTVERCVAILHGDVTCEDDVSALVDASRQVPGVRDVRSHLHVGLTAGDTRPSAGADGPSPGLRALLDAARRRGGGDETARSAVGAVLGAFAGMLLDGEREHVASHLAPDVRELFVPAPGVRPGAIRHIDELHAVVGSIGAVPRAHVPPLVAAVLAVLRNLVPDEAADVRALLPTDIRAIWDRDIRLFTG